jgi:hypothetical protein
MALKRGHLLPPGHLSSRCALKINQWKVLLDHAAQEIPSPLRARICICAAWAQGMERRSADRHGFPGVVYRTEGVECLLLALMVT